MPVIFKGHATIWSRRLGPGQLGTCTAD